MTREFPELATCRVCPQLCGVDRHAGPGSCGADWRLKLNLAHLHHGEEPVLSGTRGSGTIFFAHCNLHCCFCQNHRISQQGWGAYASIAECAELMLRLQSEGAHNVNLVSPTHYTPQLIAALQCARDKGLSIPVVWNSNAFERVETLRQLEGLVQIYLPDFKYGHALYGQKYSGARDYPFVALAAITEMRRQVGDLLLDGQGLASRGILIRHLVLPHRLAGTRELLYQMREQLGPQTALSLMAQYYPTYRAMQYPELARGITYDEYEEAVSIATELGFDRVFTQEPATQPDWTPAFQESDSKLHPDLQHFRGKEKHV